MHQLVFYTTPGCHLCEHAAVLLEEFAQQTQGRLQFEVEEVDIAGDEALGDLYGIRIPVVKNAGNAREIGWPFDLDGLASLF